MDGAREQEGWLLRVRSQPSAHTNVDLQRPIPRVTTSDCGRVYIRGLGWGEGGKQSYGWSRCCINISLGATTEIKAKCPSRSEDWPRHRDEIATRRPTRRSRLARLVNLGSDLIGVGITTSRSSKLDPKNRLFYGRFEFLEGREMRRYVATHVGQSALRYILW